jgi:hypothetical protein
MSIAYIHIKVGNQVSEAARCDCTNIVSIVHRKDIPDPGAQCRDLHKSEL